MKTGAAFMGFLFSAAIGVAVGYAVRGAQDASPVGKPEKTAVAKRPEPKAPAAPPAGNEDVFKVPVGDSYQKGPKDALVTIVEFSDFQCPFCARVGPTLERIMKTYEGDVRIVFKHQPLPFHRDAPLASEYALAAGEQGKFWEMHDKLFENPRRLKEPDLKEHAQALGLDQDKIASYIASGKGKRVIQEDQALARKIGANGTPAFYINGVKLSGAQPFDNFKRIIDAQKARAERVLASGVSKSALYEKLVADGRTSAPPPPQRRAPPPPTRQKIELLSTTPAKGGQEPLVTIVEFSDFQCPFCSRVNPTLKQVMDKYGDDVQVRFRNQPLSFHQNAMPAAKAALAAHKQGKFWEMHDKLFQNQRALGASDLERYAEAIGLDMEKFKADMNGSEVAQIIAKDQTDASKFGARGTPTLFVNGAPIRGAQPYAAFEKVIDRELAYAKTLLAQGVPRAQIHATVIARQGGKVIKPDAPIAAAPAPKLAPAEAQPKLVAPKGAPTPEPPKTQPKPAPVEVDPVPEPKEPAPEPAQAAPEPPQAPAAPSEAPGEPADEQPVAPVEVALGNAPTKGPADAPVKLVVFSDFECPFCIRLKPDLEKLLLLYGDKVSLSFKHFPLMIHRTARSAAVASLAAHRQGKFWEMHDRLFAHPSEHSRETFVKLAKAIGLDTEQFEKDLDDDQLMSWVNSDIRQGGKLGVRGTPVTFVNGRIVKGAQPLETFKTLIDAELKKQDG